MICKPLPGFISAPAALAGANEPEKSHRVIDRKETKIRRNIEIFQTKTKSIQRARFAGKGEFLAEGAMPSVELWRLHLDIVINRRIGKSLEKSIEFPSVSTPVSQYRLCSSEIDFHLSHWYPSLQDQKLLSFLWAYKTQDI